MLAERTGLEPPTPCVPGRYSNQLNYRSALFPLGNEAHITVSAGWRQPFFFSRLSFAHILYFLAIFQ